jgi:hypothetical protein
MSIVVRIHTGEAIVCRWPNRISFYEGCLVYVEGPRGGVLTRTMTGMKLNSKSTTPSTPCTYEGAQ